MVNSSSNTVRNYLKEIARTPLLKAEDEVKLANQIQAMLPLLERENLTPEERKIVRQGQKAKQKMVQANLTLGGLGASKSHACKRGRFKTTQ